MKKMKIMRLGTAVLCAVVWLLQPVTLQAQVHIGNVADPANHPVGGALLDLTTSDQLGLLPLQVDIEYLDKIPEGFSERGGDGPAADLKGLVVYNTNTALADGVGIYVWDGANWNKVAPIVAGPLEAVEITTLGTGDTFCGGVTFKLTKPASWSAADWGGLSIDNVTATLAGADYPGTLTFNAVDDSYYYAITAAAVGQAAVLTVDGTIGTSVLTESTKTVTVNLNTDSSFAVGGENCFDIKRSSDTDPDWTYRVQADFTKTYDYALSGTVGSGFTITSVTWSYTSPEDAVETFTPETFSTTPASNKVTVKYNPANLIGNTNIDATGIQVVITATIVATSNGACPTAVYTVSRTVKIKNADCCTSVFDAEGNFYYAHQFGDAGCWMTQNLKSTYNDIMPSGTLTEANNAGTDYTKKYYYYPNNDIANKAAYGLLYTWAAASDRTGVSSNEVGSTSQAQTQGICPSGWHLPSDVEWNQLEKEIATNPLAYSSQTTPLAWKTAYESNTGYRPDQDFTATYWGRQMKTSSAAGSSKPSDAGGLDVLMAGALAANGTVSGYGTYAYFWTNTGSTSASAFTRRLISTYQSVHRGATTKGVQEAVRCRKDV
ncbi:MAG: hypothetical protein LBO74_08160 [Candidatus Symbiothrix sp.]|nr:hypothetical protein [Candidatus Symbiothrix sp.]